MIEARDGEKTSRLLYLFASADIWYLACKKCLDSLPRLLGREISTVFIGTS
jgi:hypothetical protein